MAITCGWLTLPADLASAKNLPSAVASDAMCSARTLIATSRSIIGSYALSTTPMPPQPSTSVIRYFPIVRPIQASAAARDPGGGVSAEVPCGTVTVSGDSLCNAVRLAWAPGAALLASSGLIRGLFLAAGRHAAVNNLIGRQVG